jgi:hypothetical protein
MLDWQTLLPILRAFETSKFQDTNTLQTSKSLELYLLNCMKLLNKRRVIVDLIPDPVC